MTSRSGRVDLRISKTFHRCQPLVTSYKWSTARDRVYPTALGRRPSIVSSFVLAGRLLLSFRFRMPSLSLLVLVSFFSFSLNGFAAPPTRTAGQALTLFRKPLVARSEQDRVLWAKGQREYLMSKYGASSIQKRSSGTIEYCYFACGCTILLTGLQTHEPECRHKLFWRARHWYTSNLVQRDLGYRIGVSLFVVYSCLY
jgi:hypothetical protein